jgi:hypothetical protein
MFGVPPGIGVGPSAARVSGYPGVKLGVFTLIVPLRFPASFGGTVRFRPERFQALWIFRRILWQTW